MNDQPQSARLFSGQLFDELVRAAGASARRRTNFNFHDGPEEPCHRFLNVMMNDTYIAPHRHLTPLKPESFLLLEGRGAFFIFDDQGEIERCDLLDANAPRTGPASASAVGVDVRPGVWHTLIVLSPHVVCFEVKPGPYVPASDKEFAPWAPRENEAGAAGYRERLRALADERLRLH